MAAGDLTPSQWLYDFLKGFEKFRPTAYLPTPRDKWTIGYGHTAGVKQGDTCTLAQADAHLAADVAWAAHAVNRDVDQVLNQNEFDALVSLVYNIGETNFAHSSLLKHLNASEYDAAAECFEQWDMQAGVPLPGLLRRREAERDRFLTPV